MKPFRKAGMLSLWVILTFCSQVLVTCSSPADTTKLKSATSVLLDTPQACFDYQFTITDEHGTENVDEPRWNTTSYIQMAHNPTENCAPPREQREILNGLFNITGFPPDEQDHLEAALLEAMYLIKHTAEILTTAAMQNQYPSSAFLRYFPSEDEPVVRKVMLQLAVQLGLIHRDSKLLERDLLTTKHDLLPLQIIHGSAAPPELCEPGVAAGMISVGNGKQEMIICGGPRVMLTDISCEEIGLFLDNGNVFQDTYVAMLLHELFHWGLFHDVLPQRLEDNAFAYDSDWYGSDERRDIIDLQVILRRRPLPVIVTPGYGPWAAQIIRQNASNVAIYNDDNYISFIAEEYLRRFRCFPFDFPDHPDLTISKQGADLPADQILCEPATPWTSGNHSIILCFAQIVIAVIIYVLGLIHAYNDTRRRAREVALMARTTTIDIDDILESCGLQSLSS